MARAMAVGMDDGSRGGGGGVETSSESMAGSPSARFETPSGFSRAALVVFPGERVVVYDPSAVVPERGARTTTDR
eukprot:6618361-Prymnesium_polylepis.1